jgi:hypothetical protein
MLFLGAGASKPLGIPTMKEFTQAVLRDMGNRKVNFEPVISSIQAGVEKFGVEPDIETILTILDGKTKPRKSLENLGAQLIAFPQEFRQVSEQDLAWLVMKEIENSIYNICSQVIPQSASKHYAGLWKILSSPMSIPYQKGATTILPAGSLNRRIFTTDYDLSMEMFLRSQNVGFDEGFRIDDSGENVFANVWSDDQIQLVKLHGSISYYLMENGKIVKSNSRLAHTDLYGERVREQMMIYPMGEKYATRRPFYEGLGQLRRALSQETFCIAIGYSFRDVAINNAFLDAIQVNSKLRVLLISPSADRIRGTLDPRFQQRVITLPRSVEDGFLPNEIAEVVSTSYPEAYPEAGVT